MTMVGQDPVVEKGPNKNNGPEKLRPKRGGGTVSEIKVVLSVGPGQVFTFTLVQ